MTAKSIKLLKINAVLFLVAIAISAYMVWHHYAIVNGDVGFGSFCSINQTFDCDAVNASAYSEFLGIPLATWGLCYYLFALMLSVMGARNAFVRREALLILAPLALLSGGAAVATLMISAAILNKVCMMCSSLQLLSVLTLVLTLLALRDFIAQSGLAHEVGEANRRRMLTLAGTGFALFAVVAIGTSFLKQDLPFDVAQFITSFRAAPKQDVPPGDSPRQGFQGENPPLQLVEFADFQCPACAAAAKRMHHLIKVYADRVQLVFKNFPLDSSCNPHITMRIHDGACLAAKASLCANKEGKFVDLYERLFENRKDIKMDNVMAWAAELGLDKAKFEQCLTSDEVQDAVRRDADLAARLGVEATPTFFANGRKVEGALDEAKLRILLDEIKR